MSDVTPRTLHCADTPVLEPDAPLKVALIGAGNRSITIYAPQMPVLKPWIDVVAVCDPVRKNCDALAERLGARAYGDIHQLVRDRPMEAAIVVTPVPSHHSISVYLSSHGIHNLTETMWASMVCQAKEMADVAAKHGVIVRVAENFFRWPSDRFAQTVRDSGYLGRIGRIFSYADHTGYHNNSRWIAFARSRPRWVQSFMHAMEHPAFYSMPQRKHTGEELKLRVFGFPDDFVVVDVGSGHVKGHLGRHPRPGYTERQGTRGTLIHRATGHLWGEGTQTELRRVSDDRLAPAQEAADNLWSGGLADQITPVILEVQDDCWARSYADTPEGRIEYVNRLRAVRRGKQHQSTWYSVAVVSHIVDFVLAVRGVRKSEFDEKDALASQMMEIGARESALHEGRRIALPIEGDLEGDALERERQRQELGVDPLDAEAMLAVSYPRP